MAEIGMFNVFDMKTNAPLVAGAGMANPYMAAFQVASSLFGGSSVKVSKTGSQAESFSGSVDFANDDAIEFDNRLLDLSDFKSVTIAAAVIVGAIYIYKKVI